MTLNDANQCAQIAVLKENNKGRDIYLRKGLLFFRRVTLREDIHPFLGLLS